MLLNVNVCDFPGIAAEIDAAVVVGVEVGAVVGARDMDSDPAEVAEELTAADVEVILAPICVNLNGT